MVCLSATSDGPVFIYCYLLAVLVKERIYRDSTLWWGSVVVRKALGWLYGRLGVKCIIYDGVLD